MNTNKFFESKQEFKQRFGNDYPTSREEFTLIFLATIAEYISGVDENDYETEEEYENARIASDRYRYCQKMASARRALKYDGEAGKAVWEEFLDWVTDNFLPEFST